MLRFLRVFIVAFLIIPGVVYSTTNSVKPVADTLTAQKMQNPVIINPKKVNQLPAVDAMRSPGIKEFLSPTKLNAKHFWLTNFTGTNKIAWKIAVPVKGNYEVILLVNSKRGASVRINTKHHRVDFSSTQNGWQRSAVGILQLNAGKDVISLKTASLKDTIEIEAVELININEKEALAKRIKAFRGNTAWIKTAGYGIMVQGGGWSYPREGDKKPWPQFAADFDANAFVNSIDEMGGKYLVWSVTWIDYLFPAPIKAIGDLMPNRISKRDLVADLIKACHQHHIRFMIYYHIGHDSKDVLLAKGWKDSTEQDYPSRQRWLNTESKIFSEVGRRYGTGLDGVFCDDGCVWYPADFEKLGAALKAGNPQRIICYNPWIGPCLTPFQDFYAGEGLDPTKTPYTLKNGIISTGPQKDLRMWGCFVLDGPDWGNYKKNTIADSPKGWTPDKIAAMTRRLEQEKYSVAIDLMMYEDGSFSSESFNLLKAAAKKLKRAKQAQNK